MIQRNPPLVFGILVLLGLLGSIEQATAQWTVTPRSIFDLANGPVVDPMELSGLTYFGPASGNLERFIAVEDSGNRLVSFDVALTSNGTIFSATGVDSQTLSPGFDFEGVAYTNPIRSTVFVSEENTPGVHEYDLLTGNQLQSVAIPAVYSNIRPNAGFESLTRSIGGTRMWTANEEAMTIDGPLATDSVGTLVRLQQLDVSGNNVTATAQYAYEVDPVHAPGLSPASGLVDLALLPDGTLLALERSAAENAPTFESRIYQVDFANATNIRDSPFDSGLIGEVFTPVNKTLLWSGQVGGIFNLGENMEGLSLGPQLANGNWTLLGIVDDGDQISQNTVVSFEISAPTCSLAGDYDCSGTVDQFDYDTWKDTFGSTTLLFADGNGNGTVDAADYTVWRNNLGATDSSAATESIPEPSTWLLFCMAFLVTVPGWKNLLLVSQFYQ